MKMQITVKIPMSKVSVEIIKYKPCSNLQIQGGCIWNTIISQFTSHRILIVLVSDKILIVNFD